MNKTEIIDELFEKTPFSKLQIVDKVQIVRKGKSQLSLPDLKFKHREKNWLHTRSFNDDNYRKYLQLTASSKSQIMLLALFIFSPLIKAFGIK